MASGAPSKLRLSFFSSMARMLAARLVPASRFLPSSVSRNLPSASTRRTTISRSSWPSEREHGVDEVVPRALLAELDFQAVGEEGEQIGPAASRQSQSRDLLPWAKQPAQLPT